MSRQSLTALETANEIRVARANARHALREGKLTLSEALELPCTQTATLESLLLAQSKWGPVRTQRFFSTLSWKYGSPMKPNRRVGDLTPGQREVLKEATTE